MTETRALSQPVEENSEYALQIQHIIASIAFSLISKMIANLTHHCACHIECTFVEYCISILNISLITSNQNFHIQFLEV